MTEKPEIKYTFNEELSEVHLQYLQGIADYHSDRNKVIEGKLAQINRQAGVILSLTGLFIPIFYDKLIYFHFWFKLVIFILFIIGFILLAISIIKSRNILNIHKYQYVVNSEKTIFNNHKSKGEFIEEQINDTLYGIRNNVKVINGKGTELILANNLFTTGLIIITSLSLLLIISSLNYNPPKKSNEIIIQNEVNLSNLSPKLDSIYNSTSLQNNTKDSITVK